MSATYAPSYPPADSEARAALLKWVRKTPLAYGPWRPFKALFKQLEADPQPDEEILAAILARLDEAPLRVAQTGTPGLTLGRLQQVRHVRLIGGGLVVFGSTRGWGSPDTLAGFALASDNPLGVEEGEKRSLRNATEQSALTDTHALWYTPGGQGALDKTSFATPSGDATRTEPAVLVPSALIATSQSAFVATGQTGGRTAGARGGVDVYDLTTPTPQRLTRISLENATRLQVSPSRNLLIVEVGASGFRWGGMPTKGGLHVFDVSRPDAPREVGKLSLPPSGWFLTDDYLLQANGDTITIHALSDPRFREVGRWQYVPKQQWGTPTLTFAGAIGSTVWVGAQYGQGITQLDLSNPRQPQVIGVLNAYYNLQIVGRRGDILYTTDNYRVGVWDVSNPQAPAQLGTPPSPETLGYLKRRVRRLLHRIGTTDEAQYVRVTGALLAQGGRKSDLDFGAQWALADALYGGSGAYVQMSHGRGKYVPNRALSRPLQIRRRDERFPAAWNAHPQEAAKLLSAPDAVSDAYLLAVRVLRAARQPIPAVTNDKVLGKMLAHTSPLLRSVGARNAAQLARQGRELPADVTALAFLYASGANRALIAGSLDARARNTQWNKQFAERLLSHVLAAWMQAEGDVRKLRRVLSAVVLLGERFVDVMNAEQLVPLAPALLLSRRADLTNLVARLARTTNLALLYSWLQRLSDPALTDADREPVLVALEGAVSAMQTPQVLQNVIQNDSLAALHSMAWRLLAASNTGKEAVAALWRVLLDRPQLTPALQSAMTSPYALRLLTSANLPADEISSRLQSRPFLAPLLSEETFRLMVQTTPMASVLTLVGTLDDAPFARLRTVLLRLLREGVGVPELWAALPDALKTDANGRIAARILEDADFAGVLVSLPMENVDTVLAIYEPLLDDLVTAWANAHPSAFGRDSEPLTQAATSPLSRFRRWGLDRVGQVGLDLPVALRLMESDLPDALAVGRAYFEQVTDPKDAFEYALALADSPARGVRRYAREFMTARLDVLPRADLYTSLFENSDPEMRQWVAERLGDEPAPTDGGIDTAPFDRDVLRSRDTARPAKEKIKARAVRTGTVDTETLLSLARGTGTPRDAEWALSQLARRALAGEKIEGFSVDGVAG